MSEYLFTLHNNKGIIISQKLQQKQNSMNFGYAWFQ